MDIFESIVVYRGIERILIVLFSGLSFVLGWHLFKVGILSEQKAEVKAGEIFIKLQKVGPGVFFALFGASVFIYSLSSPFAYKESSTPSNDSDKPFSFTYLYQDQSKYLELSKSINTLKDIFELLPNNNLSSNDQRLVNRALVKLESERNVWVVSIFGKKTYEAWIKNGEDFLINPENVKKEIRDHLEEIKPWMAHSLDN